MKCNFLLTRILFVFNLLKRVGFAVLLLGIHQTSAVEIEWSRSFGGNGNDYANSVVMSNDSIIVFAGQTYSFADGDGCMMAVSSNGDSIWLHSYPSVGRLFDVVKVADGGLIAAGSWQDDSCIGCAGLVKTDSAGNETWTRQYSIHGSSTFRSLCELSNSDIAVVGDGGFGQQMFIVLLKLTSSGDTIWTRQIHEAWLAHKIVLSADGGYLIAAQSPTEGSGFRACAIKTDSMGSVTWSLVDTASAGESSYYDVASVGDSGYVFVGSSADSKPFACYIDNSGNLRAESSLEEYERGAIRGVSVVESEGDEQVVCFGSYSMNGGNKFTALYRDGQLFNVYNFSFGSDCILVSGCVAPNSIGYSVEWSVPENLDNWQFGVTKYALDSTTDVDNVPYNPDFSLSFYPNPFNSTLSISLDVPLYQDVTLSLYDLLGREVDVIYRGRLSSQTISYVAPAGLASGVYFLRVSTNSQSVLGKVVLLK